jgi:2-polyprenyl-3-methyl-5-hydroxy-6-metoxy-1,4-benzoquinol methylase
MTKELMAAHEDPPRAGEIWRPMRDASRAVVVLGNRDDVVSYAWLEVTPVQVCTSSLEAWRSEFDVAFEMQDHADATPARRQRLIDDFEGLFRGSAVLELGAHIGGLTQSIVRYAKSVTVLENNPRCIPVLEAKFSGQVDLVHDDMHRALWRLPRRGFDLIVCAGVLYHSAHPFWLLEAMAQLEPRLILIDTMNHGVDGVRVVSKVMTNSLNYRYNNSPDCGFSMVLGDTLIEGAMGRLGYKHMERIAKDTVPIAPDRDSEFFRDWRGGFAAWFRRDA